jgi:hypothetical protein
MQPERPAPDLRHPDWCDAEECVAGDPVLASHRSTPLRLARQRAGDVAVTAQVWMTADEPIDVATPILALTFDRSSHLPDVVSIEFDGPVAAALIDLLAGLRPTVSSGGGR